ncbi:vomeronasal type-1 receptor 4-like [Lepus europaeus]|uniref:vomeronasal type-1 receptor 4-like n=1 Tax=Lepus europaeus TaxID=9983 RepID=UPI002B47ED64|nr:vomeronasal type-1 receptor 4-like [Lepus europaeus]
MPTLVLETKRNWGFSMLVGKKEAFSKEASLEPGNLRIRDNNQALGDDGLVTRDWTTGMIYLSQTITGILGNFSLISHYLYLYFTGCKFRSTDLIIKHLTVANCLVILSRGVPQTTNALGMRHFLTDIACKLMFYVHRVGRDASISSTCLLSIFQVITISPRNTMWAKLKAKAPKYIGHSIILFWMVNLILNAIVPVYVTGNRSDKNITSKTDLGYCSSINSDRFTEYAALYAALVLLRDIFFVALMLWASSSMVVTLCRHKQQVQYIHGTSVSSRSSPESRATQSILVLVSTFVTLFTLSSFFHIGVTVLSNPSLWLVNTSALLSVSFPAVSPYILMSHDSRESKAQSQ